MEDFIATVISSSRDRSVCLLAPDSPHSVSNTRWRGSTGGFRIPELLHHGRRAGKEKIHPNTSGQRWNNFNNSYIDRSFVVSGNNRVVKPKCKQFTSLNKMLSNSKVLIVHISFTALINNEGIGGIRKVPRRIKCTFCSCRKQSCCKAEMLPSYTSLLKKLSNFPQALTGTILLMLY